MLSVKKLLGLGSPIYDIIAKVSREVVANHKLTYGRKEQDNGKNIKFFEVLDRSLDKHIVPGGSVLNALKVSKWILKHNHNIECGLLGCIGDDPEGDKIVHHLQKSGVQTIVQVAKGRKTSKRGVGILNSERCFLSTVDASKFLSESFIEQNKDHIYNADFLLVEGYFMKQNAHLMQNMIDAFVSKNKKVGITLSANFIIKECFEDVVLSCKKADFVFCNINEAICFISKARLEHMLSEELGIEKAIHKVINGGKRTVVVITKGKHPISLSVYNPETRSMELFITKEVEAIPNHFIVDTNGCGDAFVGGFLSQHLQDKSFEESLNAGIWASSIVLQNIGCTFPYLIEYNAP